MFEIIRFSYAFPRQRRATRNALYFIYTSEDLSFQRILRESAAGKKERKRELEQNAGIIKGCVTFR